MLGLRLENIEPEIPENSNWDAGGNLRCHGCGCILRFKEDWWQFYGHWLYCLSCIPDRNGFM